MLIAALFTIIRTWKQLKWPPTDEQIKKMWYIFTIEYPQPLKKKKKNEITPSAVTWMGLEIVIPSEVSQRKATII